MVEIDGVFGLTDNRKGVALFDGLCLQRQAEQHQQGQKDARYDHDKATPHGKVLIEKRLLSLNLK